MIKNVKCSRTLFPFQNMWDETTGGHRYIYTKTVEKMGFSIMII